MKAEEEGQKEKIWSQKRKTVRRGEGGMEERDLRKGEYEDRTGSIVYIIKIRGKRRTDG